jgi:hypothetical protein
VEYRIGSSYPLHRRNTASLAREIKSHPTSLGRIPGSLT